MTSDGAEPALFLHAPAVGKGEKSGSCPKVSAGRSACPQALKRLRVVVLQLQFATFCNSKLTHLCSAPPLFYGIIEDDLKKRLINQEHDNKSIELKSHFDKQPKEVFSWMTLVLYYYTIHILKVGI